DGAIKISHRQYTNLDKEGDTVLKIMKSGGGSGTAAAGSVVVDLCLLLPEDCIANVLSLTSPRDACRLSLVASTFRAAAESDVVWERFLPCDYKDIIARTVDPSPFSPLPFTSKKQLYLWLSDHPLIIDQGTKVKLVEINSIA
ncbi:hypothetical protein U1Q18_046802, partial [Sarracenia purpurea var. burkii]